MDDAYQPHSQDADHAIALARDSDRPIDLVLTDVVMPAMKKPAVFEQVRRYHPKVKVLYMSGYTDNVIANRGVLKQGAAFLQKPFSMESLSAKVREVIDT